MGKVVADFQTPPSLTPPEGDVSFNSINNTPIGGVTPSSGAFTTLSASTSATLPSATTIGDTNIPSALASRSPAQGLILSGSQGRVYSNPALGQVAGAKGVIMWVDVPTADPSAATGEMSLSVAGAFPSARGASLYMDTSGRLVFVLYGSSTSDARIATVAKSAFRTPYSGKRVPVRIELNGTTLVLAVFGTALSYTETTSGTPPAWTDVVDITYVDFGSLGSGNPSSGFIRGAAYLGSLTDAEWTAIVDKGTYPAWWYVAGGAGVTLNTASFTDFNMSTFTGASATGFTATNADGSQRFAGAAPVVHSVRPGDKFTVVYDLTVASGSVPAFAVAKLGTGTYSAWSNMTVGVGQIMTITATNAASGMNLAVRSNSIGGFALSNVKFFKQGCVAEMDPLWNGLGTVYPDSSGAGRNFTLPSSGAVPAVIGTRNPTYETVTTTGNATVGGALTASNSLIATTATTGANNFEGARLTNTNAAGGVYLSFNESNSALTPAYILRYGSTHATLPNVIDIVASGTGGYVRLPSALGISNTTAATAVNTGAFKSPNFGFSGNLGGASFLGGALGVAGVLTHAGTFAGIHVHDASTAQTIATGTAYAKITAFTDNDPSNDCTADAANDKITITRAGIYKVGGSASFYSDTNNVTWKATAFLDGVEQNNVHWEHKIGTGADLGNASFSGFVDVTSVPVDLDLRMRHDQAGNVALTITYSNLNVSFEGNT